MTAEETLSAEQASCLYLCTELKDGTPLILRAIQPDDKYELMEIYPRLSARTLYMRFFSVIPSPSLRTVARYTTVDFETHLALVALFGEEQKIVGACRLIRHCGQSSQAELACIVVDDMQHKGIGRVMITHLLALGRQWGVTKVFALVHGQNHSMLKLLKSIGYPAEFLYDDGEFSITIDVANPPSLDNASHHTNIGAMHQGIDVPEDLPSS